MTKTSFFRFFAISLMAAASLAAVPGYAEQFAGGVGGVRLGAPRAAALGALLENGIQLDVDKIVCLESVAEKYKPFGDRLCKMPALPGSTYLAVPVSKVSLMFKDDKVVLIGLEVRASRSAYADMLGKLSTLLGAPSESHADNVLWVEELNVQRPTAVKLIADESVAFVVYSDAAMR